MNISKCLSCSEKIQRFIEKKSYTMARQRSEDNTHFHYGVSFYEYGICLKHHYNRFDRTKVIWDPCIKCKFKGITKYRDIRNIKDEELSILRDEMLKLREELENYKKQQNSEISELRSKITVPKTKGKTNSSRIGFAEQTKLDSVGNILDENLFDLTDLIDMCDIVGKLSDKTVPNYSVPSEQDLQSKLVEDIEDAPNLDLSWASSAFESKSIETVFTEQIKNKIEQSEPQVKIFSKFKKQDGTAK